MCLDFFTNSWRESGFSAKEFSRNIKKTWSYLGKSWKSGRWCGRNSSISELNHIDYIESSLSSLVLLNPWPLYRTETENKKLPSNRQLGLFPEIGAYPSTSFPGPLPWLLSRSQVRGPGNKVATPSKYRSQFFHKFRNPALKRVKSRIPKKLEYFGRPRT